LERFSIKILTSSRADYSVYLPLLKALRKDGSFEVRIVAFGTHLSQKYGSTVEAIVRDGLFPVDRVDTMAEGDSPADIATSMGKTTKAFATYWQKESVSTDLVICIGDRYEMFSAVAATVPFNLEVAHFYGGEQTLGAIDDRFRHCISIMSELHFTSTKKYADNVARITGNKKNIHNVGALATDSIVGFQPLTAEQFESRFGFSLHSPVLCTYHPVTTLPDGGMRELEALVTFLATVKGQVVITMPNADTFGQKVRDEWKKLEERSNIIFVESLGFDGYYTAMSACSLVIGNSSSGIVEAASFGKYAINIGSRQLGRLAGKNVIHCTGTLPEINKVYRSVSKRRSPGKKNIYGEGKTTGKVMAILKVIQKKRGISR
jgi:GDP/UDP-N,N'-diacetylbacillosamine 2-epimerase (hydrolysing)